MSMPPPPPALRRAGGAARALGRGIDGELRVQIDLADRDHPQPERGGRGVGAQAGALERDAGGLLAGGRAVRDLEVRAADARAAERREDRAELRQVGRADLQRRRGVIAHAAAAAGAEAAHRAGPHVGPRDAERVEVAQHRCDAALDEAAGDRRGRARRVISPATVAVSGTARTVATSTTTSGVGSCAAAGAAGASRAVATKGRARRRRRMVPLYPLRAGCRLGAGRAAFRTPLRPAPPRAPR